MGRIQSLKLPSGLAPVSSRRSLAWNVSSRSPNRCGAEFDSGRSETAT